jgi:hypothetical protein
MITEIVNINFFEKKINMVVYNYEYYFNNNLHNDGLDIISKCIKGYDNCWEPYQTEITKEILKEGNNVFIDIGCHLGYYSLLAASLNNTVYSIDSNKNNYNLFLKNITLNNYKNNITCLNKCVDKTFDLFNIPLQTRIRLIKCDIEGFEIEFVESIFNRLQNKMIDFLILEISPNLNSNYPECVLQINKLGYYIYDIGLSPQRNLDKTTSLLTLKNKLITFNNIDDITKYVISFPEGQSNFLFTHLII